MDEAQRLQDGARTLGVALNEGTAGALVRYLDLLQKWNRAYNLTSVRERDEMLTRHLLDSLSLAPFLHASRILDVGSGGGLPGIVMALLYPERDFTLLDTNSKKTRFLTQCRIELRLDNLHIEQARAEQFQPRRTFPQISCRAFTALDALVNWCDHLLDADGAFLAMKGAWPGSEIDALPAGWAVTESWPIQVPGLDAERHILQIRRRAGSGPE